MQEITLLGLANADKETATWKFLRVRKGLVLCYNLVSHGRRVHQSLVYASDSALSLHGLPPMKKTRRKRFCAERQGTLKNVRRRRHRWS